MSKHQQQTDREIHEDQLLNFLVNQLGEKVPLPLANNTKINAEDLDLDALHLQERLTIGESDPLPPPGEVRAGPVRTSR